MPRLPPLLHRHIPTVIAALLVTTARWWTSRGRVVFHIRPDEPGQLAIARFVGRGARWNMFNHSTWRPAYGTLISPTTWFTDDPATMYRAALGVNALLGGASCVLLAVLAARLTGLSRTMCAVLAALAVLAPTVLFTTDWVWSEALVQTTFLVVVLAALRFQDTAAMRWGVVLVLAAALGFATHSRLLPLAAMAGVLIVVAVVRRRLALWRAGALLALQVVALVAVSAYSRYLVERIWDDPAATNTAGGVAGRLGHVGALGRVAARPGLVPARRDRRARRARHDRPRPRRRAPGGGAAARRRRPGRPRRRGAARRPLHRLHDRPLAARPDRLRPLQRRRDGPCRGRRDGRRRDEQPAAAADRRHGRRGRDRCHRRRGLPHERRRSAGAVAAAADGARPRALRAQRPPPRRRA